MAKAEDTDIIRPEDIPYPFVYRTELTTFNGWDNRAFPVEPPRPEDLRIRSTAVFEDAKGLVDYLDKLLEVSGFDQVMGNVDAVLWKDIHKLREHITRNRTELEADARTIDKFPLGGQKYLEREWELSAKAHARLYRNLMEMEYLYGLLKGLSARLSSSVENWVGDMDRDEEIAMQKKLDEFREQEYDSVRKTLVRLRYARRAANGRTVNV